MNVYLGTTRDQQLRDLYIKGNSAQEIKKKMKLTLSARQIQRRLKAEGLIRTAGDAFRLAVKRGLVTYHKNPNATIRKTISPRLRTMVFERDGYRCVLCGSDSTHARIQIDHIDDNPRNNIIDNLRVLCEPCNKGKIPKMKVDEFGNWQKNL